MQNDQVVIEAVREFTRREVAPIAERIDREDWYPLSLLRSMGNMGILDPLGNGGDLLDTSLILLELGRWSGSVGLIQDVQGELVIETLRKFGGDNEVIGGLSSGRSIGSFALSESCCGSDFKSMRTRASRSGDRWSISGEKTWITQGLYSDVILLFARSNKGVSAFVLRDKDCPHRDKIEVMGNRGTGTASIRFQECEADLLGNEGEGTEIAKYALRVGRIAITALALGVAEGSLEEALTWASSREVAGTKLVDYQGIRWGIAEVLSRIKAAHSLLKYTCSSPTPENVASLKLFGTRTASVTVDLAVQIMGGLGYAKGTRTERAYRDIRLTRIGEGTDEVQRNIISHAVKERGVEYFLEDM